MIDRITIELVEVGTPDDPDSTYHIKVIKGGKMVDSASAATWNVNGMGAWDFVEIFRVKYGPLPAYLYQPGGWCSIPASGTPPWSAA